MTNTNTTTKPGVLAATFGGALQAQLLREIAEGDTGKYYPAGCFVSLARRGLIDNTDKITDAGRAAIARIGGEA